jgi:hypothetical protein
VDRLGEKGIAMADRLLAVFVIPLAIVGGAILGVALGLLLYLRLFVGLSCMLLELFGILRKRPCDSSMTYSV